MHTNRPNRQTKYQINKKKTKNQSKFRIKTQQSCHDEIITLPESFSLLSPTLYLPQFSVKSKNLNTIDGKVSQITTRISICCSFVNENFSKGIRKVTRWFLRPKNSESFAFCESDPKRLRFLWHRMKPHGTEKHNMKSNNYFRLLGEISTINFTPLLSLCCSSGFLFTVVMAFVVAFKNREETLLRFETCGRNLFWMS